MQAGHSQSVLVTGALGSGKSTVIDVARREALARSFRIGELVLPGPRLVALDAESDKRSRRVVAAGLTTLHEFFRLARLSADRWLVTLDDAQTLDAEEIAAVARLISSPGQGGVLFLICAAEGPDGVGMRLTQLQAQLGTVGSVVSHRLGPWTGIDVLDLALSRTPGIPPAVRFGFEIAQVTGGNPALVHAYTDLAVGLPEDEKLTVVSGARRLVDLVPPRLVTQLVQARTAMLTGDVRRLIQVLALWGLPGNAPTLADLSGIPIAVVMQSLDALEDAGHVRLYEGDEAPGDGPSFELPDAATGQVLARSAPSLLAHRVHLQASRILEARHVPPGIQIIRAQHHLEAGDLTAGRAGQVVEAAKLLLHRGRWASARDLLQPVVWAAIENDLPAHVLVEGVQALAETFTRGGDARAAERLIDATRSRTGTAEPGYLASLQGLAMSWDVGGRELEAEATLRYVSAHPQSPRLTRSTALAELVRLRHWHGQPEQAVALAEYARDMHRDQPDVEANLWFQQALVARMQGRPSDSLDAARRAFWLAHRAGIRGTAARSLVAIGEAWLDSDSADRAVLWMRGALRRVERSQVFRDVAWTRNRLIPAYIESGDWTNAELAARRGLSFGVSLNLPQTARRSEAALALLHALTGRVSPLFLRSRVTARDMANPLILTSVMVALYEQQRLVGRTEHARLTILQAAEMLEARTGWERLLELEVLPRLAANRAEHGDEQGLEDVMNRYSALFTNSSFTLPISRLEFMVVQARQALLQDRPDEAAAILELARSGYQGMQYRWRWAQIAAPLAQAYARSGRRARAVETLRSGYIALERLGAHPAASRLRIDLQAIGARAPRVRAVPSTLTAKQTEVAILASRGLSDREIARELGTSVRTTTTHMHAVLKRLGLRSRYEIGDWLQQTDGAGRLPV